MYDFGFFLEEADEWRCEAWKIIRQRPDVTFSLLTKRAERIKANLPEDWGDGWDNVQIAVSTENKNELVKESHICLMFHVNQDG